jgi:hypothetical protein
MFAGRKADILPGVPSYPTILGFDVARAAHWTRRTRDFAISSTAFVSLAAALLRGAVRELWIGDSHSVCFNRPFRTANVLRAGDGIYVFHLGSRLMYSVARDGELPRWTRRLLAITAQLARRPVPVVFCLGEIDVRCHLAKHNSGTDWRLGFVRTYVTQSVALARSHGFAPVVFVPPPPPCRDHMDLEALPVVGSFATRTAAFDALRAELAACVGELDEGIHFIDPSAPIFDPTTGIRADLTDDQCHVNAAGSRIVRSIIDAELHGVAVR